MVLMDPCWKVLLDLYRMQATPRVPLAHISERQNTLSVGSTGTAHRCASQTSKLLRDLTRT